MSYWTDKTIEYLRNSDLRRARDLDLAEKLFLSPTSLRRRLRLDGTSYSKLRDAERKRRMLQELEANPMATAERLAEVGGYREPNSASRALRTWCGFGLNQVRANPSVLREAA